MPEAALSFPPLSFSPAVIVSRQALSAREHVWIARDDLLEGGTKQRAALPYLADLQARGVAEVVYASPFAGFAQVALAVSASALGMKCTIFAERDPAQPGLRPHAFSELASRHGALVQVRETLSSAEASATVAEASSFAQKIPLGFQCAGFESHLEVELRRQFIHLRRQHDFRPTRVWLPVGSGTLARVCRRVLPLEVELLLVNVHVLPDADPRLATVEGLENARLFSAEESFPERAREAPPIPSNLHYDAKLWRLIRSHGRAGDLWWNVAR